MYREEKENEKEKKKTKYLRGTFKLPKSARCVNILYASHVYISTTFAPPPSSHLQLYFFTLFYTFVLMYIYIVFESSRLASPRTAPRTSHRHTICTIVPCTVYMHIHITLAHTRTHTHIRLCCIRVGLGTRSIANLKSTGHVFLHHRRSNGKLPCFYPLVQRIVRHVYV